MYLTQFDTFFLILNLGEKFIEKTFQKQWDVTLTSLSSQQVQQELLNSLVLLKGQLEVKIAMMMMVMVVMMMVMGMISITWK